MDIALEEEVVNAVILQEAAAEAARQGAGSSQAAGDTEDISELFRDSEVEAGPKVETSAPRRARATIMESSDSRLEERPQAQLALPGLRETPTKKRTKS